LRIPYAPGALACSALLLLSLGNLLLDKDLFHRVFVSPFQPEVRFSDPFTPPPQHEGPVAAPPVNPREQGEVVDIDIDPRPPRFDAVAFILRKWIVVGLTAIVLWGAFRYCWTHRHELLTQRVLAFLLLLHVSNGFIMLGNVLCEVHPLPGFILAVIGITIMCAAGLLWRATRPVLVLPASLSHEWRRVP
jgi:hypothetical protein